MEQDRRRLRVVVIGLGRFGLAVAKTLSEHGHDVLGIDRAAAVVERTKDVVTRVMRAELSIDATVQTLPLERVAAAVVAIGTDVEANIGSTVLLLEAGVPRVVARANSRRHGAILERIGAHHVVYPEMASGESVAHGLRAPNVAGFLALDAGIGLGRLDAPAAWIGRSLAELRANRGDAMFGVLLIQRGAAILTTPEPAERVRDGDVLVLLAPKNTLDELPLPPR